MKNTQMTNLTDANAQFVKAAVFNSDALLPFGKAMMTANECYTLLAVIGSDELCRAYCGESLVRSSVRRIEIPMLIDGMLMDRRTAVEKGFALKWDEAYEQSKGNWTALLKKALETMLRAFNKASIEVSVAYGFSLARVVVSPATATIPQMLAIAGEIENFRREFLC